MKGSAVTLPMIAASMVELTDGPGEAVGFQSHRLMSYCTFVNLELPWCDLGTDMASLAPDGRVTVFRTKVGWRAGDCSEAVLQCSSHLSTTLVRFGRL